MGHDKETHVTADS